MNKRIAKYKYKQLKKNNISMLNTLYVLNIQVIKECVLPPAVY